MSQRDESTGMETPEEMRPLPDGGLSDAMPDWLRRPPAWRDLPRKDDSATAKALPDPDTSIIDPRELVTVDDLPQWLRDIAARDAAPQPGSTAPAMPEEHVVAAAPEPASPAQPASATQTIELTPAAEPTRPPGTTLPWIWAMRAAIILVILSIIYYVFIL